MPKVAVMDTKMKRRRLLTIFLDRESGSATTFCLPLPNKVEKTGTAKIREATAIKES